MVVDAANDLLEAQLVRITFVSGGTVTIGLVVFGQADGILSTVEGVIEARV